ncbi:sel1 repeat family protein [Ectothiorhodospiraceae bacterium WFHF3C12]|nr:sel1 repeat family protein [Ectothiorhodospiraceae bacterium WFHF3C12]
MEIRPAGKSAISTSLLGLWLLFAAGCTAGLPQARDARADLAALYWAADTGDPVAQRRLARIYGRGGVGVTQDYAEALAWLARAAENGDDEARALHRRWTNGERARELVVAAQAALDNDHRERAIQLLRTLARADVPEAAYRLGRLYLVEEPPGPDPARSRYWLQRAARDDDANAHYLLGTLSASSAHGAADPATAAEHWRRCTGQRHAMCEYSLGLLHLTGRGVEHDPARGRALIRRAAEQGYGKAEAWLERWRLRCAAARTPTPGCG